MLYNSGQRLSRHMQETGKNLLDQVFVQVTDEQLAVLKLKTGHQRMDSVLVSSNIRRMTWLHLLVEMVQRVRRMLVEEDQASYAEVFRSCRQGTAGQYCYRVKGDGVAVYVEAIGQLVHRLVRVISWLVTPEIFFTFNPFVVFPISSLHSPKLELFQDSQESLRYRGIDKCKSKRN
jgi:hypothetical protein